MSDAPTIHTLPTPCLGDRSYLVASDGHAIAVDVQRDIDRVERLLEEHDLHLGAVVETHFHNDYLTGGLALSRRHHAEYVVPAGPGLGYPATRAEDRFELHVGPLLLRAVSTPGHTDTHLAYALHHETTSDVAAFTGGSLLLGATGRSDLLGPDLRETLARKQYWSVRRLARLLGPDARLYPTHGFGSFCAAGAASTEGDTIADQLEDNPAFLLSEDEFIADMFAKLDPWPAYYRYMGPRNVGGVDRAGDLPDPERIGPRDLARAGAAPGLVVDTRPRERWARGHLPGSLCIDGRGAVNTWLGWLEPIDTPLTLVVDTEDDVEPVLRQLHRVGFDRVDGVHVAAGPAAPDGEVLTTSTRRVGFADLATAQRADASLVVVDVRETSEWRQGHVRGAIHVPVHRIRETFTSSPPLTSPWVYCAAGFRAAIGVSVLEQLGTTAVLVDGPVTGAAGLGADWCAGVQCGSELCTADLVPAGSSAG